MQYYVKCILVERAHFKPTKQLHFYIPILKNQFMDGKDWPICNEEDYPTAWGFETESDAWEAIKQYRIKHDDHDPD